jgi:hypothetical protein
MVAVLVGRLPHTLEHLIFLGSEQYPYKGVLDSLANRCLARGTSTCFLTGLATTSRALIKHSFFLHV